MAILKQFRQDQLNVFIMDSRDSMGQVAAQHAADCLRALLARKETVNVIFAAAPSQNETLHFLAQAEGIDWKRVNAFHMDEYIGLAPDAPQAFGRYLDEHIFSLLPFGSVHYLNGQAESPEAECERYSRLLREYPVDMVCLGIGENGHIAFNDPWVADFEDSMLVRIVPLDPVCRQQQVNDGCFETLDQVPTHAMTLTIPALTRAGHLFCTVPAASKAWAVEKTVKADVSTDVPATIMRRHPDARLFCDPASAAALLK